MIEKDSQYAGISEELLKAFNLLKSDYMIPLFREKNLFALFFLSGLSYGQISKNEIEFINNILDAASAKLSDLNVFEVVKR